MEAIMVVHRGGFILIDNLSNFKYCHVCIYTSELCLHMTGELIRVPLASPAIEEQRCEGFYIL